MITNETRRKVTVLANKLVGQNYSRPEAFTMAWKTIKTGITLPVRGVTQGSRQEALRRLSLYRPEQIETRLIPEPENPFDKNAVAVMVAIINGKGFYRLGYIPADKTRLVAAMNFLRPALLKVVSGNWTSKGHEYVTFGARLSLGGL